MGDQETLPVHRMFGKGGAGNAGGGAADNGTSIKQWTDGVGNFRLHFRLFQHGFLDKTRAFDHIFQIITDLNTGHDRGGIGHQVIAFQIIQLLSDHGLEIIADSGRRVINADLFAGAGENDAPTAADQAGADNTYVSGH
jgi:hypothetical protein